MRAAAVLIILVAACGTPKVAMRGAPYAHGTPPMPLDGDGAALVLPASGEVVGAALPSGWPVWVVHHEDGSASVLSGVVGPEDIGNARRSWRPFFEHDAWLVRWIPGTRRFVAGSLVYDDHGRVLGYEAFEVCLDRCPRIEDKPRMQRDLDTFAPTLDGADRVRAGVWRAGAEHEVAREWVKYWRTERDERNADFEVSQRAAVPPVPITDAAARPVGTYAIVEGAIVRATNDVPRVCTQKACEPCPLAAPPVTGVADDRANVPSVEGRPGVFLLQRTQAPGFQIVAQLPGGECSGEAR